MVKLIFAATTLMLSASVAFGQVERVVVRVDGMAWMFWAASLEKRLDDVDGVETIEIRVSEGTATLTATRGKSLRVDQIESAVTSAGFTPRVMTATAVGVVQAHVLRWGDADSGVEIRLLGAEAPNEGSQRVRVTGTLTVERDEGTVSLAMTVDETELVLR